jgi:GNAT superfamily N-acetyltransferase
VTDTPPGSVLQFSPRDSARFGLRVFRGVVDIVDTDALADKIERERVDVAMLRVPPQMLGALNGFARHGLAPIVADTLVCYDTELPARRATPAMSSAVTLRPATDKDAELLAGMAREIFADYVSHYHANPLFERDKILDGYAEWASRHVGAEDGSVAWLVEYEGELAGFSCCRADRASGTAIGVLNGVLPEMRSRGIYRDMLRTTVDAFTEMGMKRFEISTQVHNIAVQRAWTAHGFVLRSASNTVHVNALRSRSEISAETSALRSRSAGRSVEERR